MQKLFISIAIVLFLACCGNASLPAKPMTKAEQNQALLREAETHIQNGDIVLRCGKDITSYKIREMSERDKTYSHAGIAVLKPNGIFIYHLTPPELDEPKSDTAIRLEPLEKFADPENNFELGIGRFPLTREQADQLVNHLDSLRKAGVSFDYLFDLKTRNRMYCSEMIDESLRFVTHDSISLKRNAFRDSNLVKKVSGYLKASQKVVQSRLYIPIENIYLHPAFKLIGRYKFEN